MGKLSIEDLFANHGGVVASMRSHFTSAKEVADGLQTRLGAVEAWSPSLKSAFAILLNSCCPMFLVWECDPGQSNSSERILLANDAHLSLLSETQPLLLDRMNNSWTGDWSEIQADIEQVFTTGQALRRQQNLFLTEQNDKGNSHLYTWSYSGVWDETGQIKGVFATGCRVSVEETVVAPVKEHFQDVPELQPAQQTLQMQISRLQQAEAALRESEARFEAFMSHSPTSAWIADQEGRILYLSPTYTQMFQLPQQDAVGKQIYDIYSKEFAQQFLENNDRVFQTGQVIETVETAPRPDGSIGSFLVYKFPITQASKEMLLGGVAIDITERQSTEESLRRREEELRLITNALPALVAYVDKDHYYRFNNQTYETWFGRPAATFTNRHVRDVLGEAAYETVLPHIKQALSGQRVSLETRISYDERESRYIKADYVPHTNSQGEVEGYFSLVTDISDRKQAEEALRQSEERLSLAQRAAGVGLWDWDLVANQITWSEEFYRLYGLDPAVTPSYETWLTLVMEHDRERVVQVVQEALAQQANLNVEFRILHPTKGICWIMAIGQTFYDADGQPTRMLGIALNITHRKQAEVEREHLLLREQATREAAEAAEQRARFLAKASTTLTSSLDYEYTLKSVAQAVVPTLADWCAVDILKDDGTLERLATTHVDPAKVQWGVELHRRYPPDLNAPQGLAQVLRTGQSEYYPTISDEQIVAAARDDEHLRILREIGFSSVMLVPLNARGRTLGTISFVAAESGRSYSQEDLSLAEELARRAAIALDNASLYQEAQQARQAAERAADRTTRLQAVTAALSESLTPIQVAEVIVEQSIAALEADAALMVLCSEDGSTLEIVRTVGYEVSQEKALQRFSIDSANPLADAVRTGQPVWSDPLAERLNRYPHLAKIYQRFPFEAWISLPLVVEGKAVGGLSLSFKKFKRLNQDDRDFVLALTRQCAQAIVRAQLYAAEQQARAEAERANRIKDEFLAVLSHELRSPLNPILGWARLLQTRQFDEAGTKRALETIERNAKLQTQLIDDLLDVSRILRGKMMLNVCEINLVTVIDAALETVRLSAEAKNIDLQKVILGDVELISGDAGRLQQVVWNLLANAVKFTPTGGQIEVRLARVARHSSFVAEEQPETNHQGQNQGQITHYAQIQVKDSGKGITPEFLPHVFEYFRQEDSTTTRKFGGLGLGLAIVRYLTELHGGTVEAESPGEGLGATFTVLLPISKNRGGETPDRVGTPSAAAGAFPLSNLRILVVDDEADMRELTVTILNQTGAETKAAASVVEALQAVDEFKPDILISDIGMPEMDGYELVRQIRRLSPERGGQTPAIALTAYAGEVDQQQALAAGFQQHLAKPIEPEVLVRAIATLVKA